MQSAWQKYKWIPQTVLGSAIYAAGFAFFLQPNDMSPGGISGLALLLVEVLGFGSVGILSILMNLPLFVLGGLKIGKRFFLGSLIGMLLSSLLIDGFTALHLTAVEPVIAMIYGGVICGLGLGIVFVGGTSTGGSDILVRLLKLRYRNVPIGQISLTFDALVVFDRSGVPGYEQSSVYRHYRVALRQNGGCGGIPLRLFQGGPDYLQRI